MNEGAGERVELGGRAIYLCASAEKMSAPFRSASRAGAATPRCRGSPTTRSSRRRALIERLGGFRRSRSSARGGGLPSGSCRQVPPADEALARDGALDPVAAEMVEPLLALTFSPTMITASQKRNVIPGRCEVTVDCRLLPGQTEARVEPMIVPCSATSTTSSNGSRRAGGTRSSLDTPLWRALEEWVAESRAGSAAAPLCVRGLHRQPLAARGVRHGRLRLLPFHGRAAARGGAASLIHSADERIPVADLELGVGWLRHAAAPCWGERLLFGAMAKEKVRLGGMALPNGVLVHGPHSWACAIRHEDGRIEVAAARKRLQASRIESPLLRGPARLAEALLLLPQIKAKLPRRALPLENSRTLGSMLGAAVASGLRARVEVAPVARELLSAIVSFAPAVMALRSGELAAYHGAEHISIGSYEHGKRATKEHERCGGHLVGRSSPRLRSPTSSPGSRPSSTGSARGGCAARCDRAATEVFGWMTRHPENLLARALAKPGHELQHRFSTAEPSDEQLEVAEAALKACLELESPAWSRDAEKRGQRLAPDVFDLPVEQRGGPTPTRTSTTPARRCSPTAAIPAS